MSKYWNRLIVALDLEDKQKIRRIVSTLSPKKVKFKIGTIAFTKFGPQFVNELIKKDIDVFLDLKLHDIPNTMRKSVAAITQMGCWAFTVHIKAGQEALRSLRQEVNNTARKFKLRRPLILGVTELTSQKASLSKVLRLAELAEEAGLDGVIASCWEAQAIKKHYKLKVITPGIRSSKDKKGDQKRTATAQFAFKQGADYIVVGRPIINQRGYLEAGEEILEG
jgi:orotidine-5'-phosphate decarboxylase